MKKRVLLPFVCFLLMAGVYGFRLAGIQNENIVSYTVDPKSVELKFYWKDENGQPFRSIQNLRTCVEKDNKILLFAMNGGMYKKDNSPQGLFTENSITRSAIDTSAGGGNFYLEPNGIFYVTKDNNAFISRSKLYNNTNVKYATQSGPMLVVDGEINKLFTQGSKNVFVRNGVGVLPDSRVVFAISKSEINFYDFANYFLKLGCKNALYLDGFVSRAYVPAKGKKDLDGNFGVIIAVTETKK